MKIECTVEELKELVKTPVNELTDVNNILPKHTCSNELPPHRFPLFNLQEYQHIYKEAQQEAPKEDC